MTNSSNLHSFIRSFVRSFVSNIIIIHTFYICDSMSNTNQTKSIWENLDSSAVAKALFPHPITARSDITVEKTCGQKNKDEATAFAFKNAVVQIMHTLREDYKLECAIKYGGATWQSASTRKHSIKIFCKKCLEKKLAANGEPDKSDLVALAVCNQGKENKPCVKVKKVFFHDRHNMDTKRMSGHPRHGWETVKFRVDSIFGETYKYAIEEINRFSVGSNDLPPGNRIKFKGKHTLSGSSGESDDKEHALSGSSGESDDEEHLVVEEDNNPNADRKVVMEEYDGKALEREQVAEEVEDDENGETTGRKSKRAKATFYENRVYCVLPDENSYPSISWESHRQCMIRLMFFLAAEYNISAEMAPSIGPNNMFKKLWTDFDDEAKDFKNPAAHLLLTEVSLIFGGHHLDQNDETPVHQPLHQDFSSSEGREPRALLVKFKPASFLIPLEVTRYIHVLTHGHIVGIDKGEMMLFSGDLPHAGHTWTAKGDRDWRVAIHGHIDSILWNRTLGNVDMGWDHKLAKSNAKCLATYSSLGDIIQGLEANCKATDYIVSGLQERLGDLTIKEKGRKVKAVIDKTTKVLGDLDTIVKMLKEIKDELKEG